MAVITISRGSFSGGRMLAECTAARLGYRCLDRDAIVERAAAYGVSHEGLRDALERPPTISDRFRHTKYVYLSLIQAALAEGVRVGNTVYHGNAGHLLLRGVSHVMRTRIIAPMAFRITALQTQHGLSADDAVVHIEKVDQERQKWAHYLYGIDWSDAALYDLVLNLEHLKVEEACEIIAATARQDAFKETAASRAAMDDLALASRVQAHLAVTPGTLHLEVDVTGRGGSVVIRGPWSNQAQAEEVKSAAGGVPGVVGVEVQPLAS
jgi:cytidylate kinase